MDDPLDSTFMSFHSFREMSIVYSLGSSKSIDHFWICVSVRPSTRLSERGTIWPACKWRMEVEDEDEWEEVRGWRLEREGEKEGEGERTGEGAFRMKNWRCAAYERWVTLNKAQQASEASMSILSTFSTLSRPSTLSTFINVIVGPPR